MPPGRGGPPPGGRRKRNGARIALVLSIIAGVLVLLGAGGYVGYEAYAAFAPAGNEYIGAEVPPECDLFDERVLQRVNTSNPEGYVGEQLAGSSMCTWGQTRGQDGNDPRQVILTRSEGGQGSYSNGDPLTEAREDFEGRKATVEYDSGQPAAAIEGLGDEAVIGYDDQLISNYASSAMVVRKGTTVLEIKYGGSQRVMFSNNPMPEVEGESAVRALTKQAVPKL